MADSRDVKQLVSQMTLEEKAGLCSGRDFWNTKGIERLGIPSIMMTDGPHGLRKQAESADHLGIYNSVAATCFPSAAGLASSWDEGLLTEVGEALGRESMAEKVSVLLGPGANIKRSPLCGRNFEYFSEDPCLSSRMAAAHIRGVQSQGVGASLKHFAVNNQEHRRMTVDAVVDERTLREIYLASFEEAVKQGQPWTVMCSYNKVNGTYASEHRRLLTEILRDEWGFEGFVVSDWGAVNERVAALTAGLELEMPTSGGYGDRLIVDAVQRGELAEEVLDQAVERLLQVIFKTVDQEKTTVSYDRQAHHLLARRVAGESMVLLKNEGKVLPLSASARVALIGELAEKVRYQGGGSSHVNPTQIDCLPEEMKCLSGENRVTYSAGYELASEEVDESLLRSAVEVAAQSDIAVLVAGLPERYESEGFDRTHMRLPANQIRVIEAVSAVQPNLVVVLCNGSPVEMPWLPHAKGLVEAYLGGQAVGGAIADILYGAVNPSGKLAETFPERLEDNPSYLFFPGEQDRVEYREGLFVGYRYYDAKHMEPLFPFGYGLSYTQFAYSHLTLDRERMTDHEELAVSVRVRNAGERAGKEVVQLYVHRRGNPGVQRPEQELRDFCKVELQPGEEKNVIFKLGKRAFAHYDTELQGWTVEEGDYEIRLAQSSRHPVLSATVYVSSATPRVRAYHINSTVGDLLDDPRAAGIVRELLASTPFGASASSGEEEEGSIMSAIMRDLPLRGLIAFGGGGDAARKLEEDLRALNRLQSS